MWVFLKGGHFCAIAEDQLDSSKLAVRCWNREDALVVLDGLLGDSGNETDSQERMRIIPTLVGPLNSDYPFRVVAEREDVASWVARQVRDIDFTKFKPTVGHSTKAGSIRSAVLLDVFWSGWDALRDEPLPVKRKKVLKKGAKCKVRSWLDKPGSYYSRLTHSPDLREYDPPGMGFQWTAEDEAWLAKHHANKAE